MSQAILWPAITLAAITGAVWVLLYVRRLSYMRQQGIRPDDLADATTAARLLAPVQAPADNLRNLFEVPVLFYALAALLVATGLADAMQVSLAWSYVALRALHSVIHVTWNRVVHRFAAYVASCAELFAMWLRFALAVAAQSA